MSADKDRNPVLAVYLDAKQERLKKWFEIAKREGRVSKMLMHAGADGTETSAPLPFEPKPASKPVKIRRG